MLFGSSILAAMLASLTFATPTPPAGSDSTIKLTKDCTVEYTNLFENCRGTDVIGKFGDLKGGKCIVLGQVYRYPERKICDVKEGEKDDYFQAEVVFDGGAGVLEVQFGGQQRRIEVGLEPVTLRGNGQGWDRTKG